MNLDIELFRYDNYRLYLQDFFVKRKEVQRRFSQRYFAAQTGFTDHSQLTNVVNGRRNITEPILEKLLNGLELDGARKDYFITLVKFNQSTTIQEREKWYAQLNNLRQNNEIYKVQLEQYKYYEEWYHSVVLEISVLNGWDNSFKKLAKLVRPVITAKEAKESINLLLKIGMLEKDENGMYKKSTNIIYPGDIPVYALKKARHDLVKMSIEASENMTPEERYFYNLGFAISAGKKEKYYELLAEFQGKVEAMASNDNEEPEEMYQFNVQFYPISNKLNNGGEK